VLFAQAEAADTRHDIFGKGDAAPGSGQGVLLNIRVWCPKNG
jgi:hypothetical protein